MKRFRWLWGGIALTVLLAGCGGDPAPEISPPNKVVDSPPEDPAPVELTPEEKAQQEAQALKERNIKEAKSLVSGFMDAYNVAVFGDFNPLPLYEFAPPSEGTQAMYLDLEKTKKDTESSGASWTGMFVVKSKSVKEYSLGPEGKSQERIKIETCTQAKDVLIHFSDGTTRPGDGPLYALSTFVVQHTGPEQPWIITQFVYGGQPCG